MEMKSTIVFLFLLKTILVHIATAPEPIYDEIFRCKKDSGTFQPNSPYKTNLMTTLNKLATETALKDDGHNIETAGTKPNETVNAVALCEGYVKTKDCVSCVKETIPLLLQKCPNQKGAAAWRPSCLVRYGAPVVNHYDVWFVAHQISAFKADDVPLLQKTLPMLVDSLMRKALDPGSSPRGYAFDTLNYGRPLQTLFMAMQCSKELSNSDCKKCLVHVSNEMKPCCSGVKRAAVITPNCYMTYAHEDFRAT